MPREFARPASGSKLLLVETTQVPKQAQSKTPVASRVGKGAWLRELLFRESVLRVVLNTQAQGRCGKSPTS
jgi:hypothetical protein